MSVFQRPTFASRRSSRTAFLLITPFVLWSCGEGGSGGVEPPDLTEPPVAEDVTVETGKHRWVEVALQGESSEGQSLSYAVVEGPSSGVVELTPVGSDGSRARYTPDVGFSGEDRFTYEVRAGDQADRGEVTVRVVNTAPVVEGVEVRRPASGGVTVAFSARDADGDALEFRVATAPLNGSVGAFTVVEESGGVGPAGAAGAMSDAATGSAAQGPAPIERVVSVQIRYEPEAGFPGPDLFEVEVSDGDDLSEPGRMVVIANQPPRIEGDVDGSGRARFTFDASRRGTTEVSIPLVSPSGADLTFQVTRDPENGTLAPVVLEEVAAGVVAASGVSGAGSPSLDGSPRHFTASIHYTSETGFSGTDGFDFEVSDGMDEVEGEVEFDVGGDNRPPEAEEVGVTGARGQPVVVTLVGSDPDGDPLSFRVVEAPSAGTLTELMQLDGTTAQLTYTPGAGAGRSDTFRYLADDGLAESAPATVTIQLQNQAPVATPRTGPNAVTTPKNTSIGVSLTGTDADGDPLHFTVQSPVNGTLGAVTQTGAHSASVVFTPTPGFQGAASFQFTVHDGLDASAPAVVAVNVPNQAPTVSAPAAVPTGAGAPVTITLTGADPDGDPLTFQIATPPANGALGAVTSTGPTSATVTYTPAGGFGGTDTFSFTATDGAASSAPATATITVNHLPEADPKAGADGLILPKNQPFTITLTGSDPEGAPLTFAVSSPPTNGSLTAPVQVTPTSATVEYTPNTGFDGADAFQFMVNDGLDDSAPASVELDVVNQAPTADDLGPERIPFGTSITLVLTGADPDGDPLTFAVSGGPSHGSLGAVTPIDGSSATVEYTPNTGFAGADAFQFTVSDGTDTSAAGTVSLTVVAPPSLDRVFPDTGTRGSTVTVTLTGTEFVTGATTVAVDGAGVGVSNVSVLNETTLTADLAIAPGAAIGDRDVTVTTSDGTSTAATFTVLPLPPTLTGISPDTGTRWSTVTVTLTGTEFVTGATTVAVDGAGVGVSNVSVTSETTLTADFTIAGAVPGLRTVTVTTTGGTSAGVGFTVELNTLTFSYTGGQQDFIVPAGVSSVIVQAYGAQGGDGVSSGGLGGGVTATLPVTAGEVLAVFVGGQGGAQVTAGFNGGGAGGDGPGADGGGGGGASDVRQGGNGLADRILVAGGGGGGGAGPGGSNIAGAGGGGGGTTAANGANGTGGPGGGGGGGGGSQTSGGSGGNGSNGGDDGGAGTLGTGGTGGGNNTDEGGGGGGGYYGGGGGGEDDNAWGGGGGGGGSSFVIGTATDVVHEQGVRAGHGEVTISW